MIIVFDVGMSKVICFIVKGIKFNGCSCVFICVIGVGY